MATMTVVALASALRYHTAANTVSNRLTGFLEQC